MDWDDFQKRALAVMPEQELKPKRCWIGVLSHDKIPEQQLKSDDFIWMLGHAKIPMNKIYETYERRNGVEGLDVQLHFKDKPANRGDLVRTFLVSDESFVVFSASLPLPTPRRESDVQAEIAASQTEGDATLPSEPQRDLEPVGASHIGMEVKAERTNSQPPQSLPFHNSQPNNDQDPSQNSQSFLKAHVLPFDPDSIFNREVTPEPQKDLISTDHYIGQVIEQQDPIILEAGVRKARRALVELKSTFSQYGASDPDAQSWKTSITKLMSQPTQKRTVVGVVGNTGAGKSSVINAMLDEERLVPTNCMRACTAVVTEISWNDDADPSARYRAEIEFIERDDWARELNVLIKEFLSDSGTLSRDAWDPNTDAGIAWAKFHSVYPTIPRDSLHKCTISELMAEGNVLKVLGTTKKIRTSLPSRFYQELQRYVDSKEKVTKKDRNREKGKGKKQVFEMEHWPLIKVVRIYTKSAALSTGAVIVDLPGVQDSNAARASVAQGYLKQVTGLWIVAPITRAVDDKAAKTLLSDSFKRQLKYDGGFSSVSFICSKTDDISLTEAIDSLGLEDEVNEFERQKRHHNEHIERIQRKISEYRESREEYKVALRNASNDLDIWESLQERLDDDKPAYAPVSKSKRKMDSSSEKPRKRRIGWDNDSDEETLGSDDEGTQRDGADDQVSSQMARTELTGEDVRAKLKELKSTKKNARRESIKIGTSIEDLKPQIHEHQAKIEGLRAQISHICIAGRNQYSKTAIQQDFAAGIKEIDQENAAEENEDNFNPDEELRDYDQVARSLPVFCVSSRAYQKMCGRLQKDDGVPGFVNTEETEIPQLQAHCQKLTESGRIQTCRTFLRSVCQLLTTFNLWASNDGSGVKLTDEDKSQQINYLQRRLSDLQRGLKEAIGACINEMRVEIQSQILDKCPQLINDAIQAAPATALGWGSHRDTGGLAWATYKAVCRREGVYQSSSAGHKDFNGDLVDPILKKLATGWERAFQSRLPKAFDTYIANSGKILHNFHEAIETRAHQNGVGLANLSILKTQVQIYEQLFKDLSVVLVTQMTELQREANREFTPTIATIMHAVYDTCTMESGTGSFKRMKEYMMDHVERKRHEMFYEAIKTVEKHLKEMCKALQYSMEVKADEIFYQMGRDYTHVIGGTARDHPVLVQPKEERDLRLHIQCVLRGIDDQFEPIARGELEPQDSERDSDTQADDTDVAKAEDSGVFKSANEDTSSTEDEFNTTAITEPTPYEHAERLAHVDNELSRSWPVPPSDDEMNDEEL